MKKNCGYVLFALVLLVIAVVAAPAQNGTIKGKATDNQTGAALPGATLLLEKTSFGAAADIDGSYVITNIPAGSYTLVARFIGYEQIRQIVTVSDSEVQVIDVKLKSSSVLLNPVIVTAIGTKAERDQMGTSVSSIEAKEIATAGAHDLISNLAAKAPGVNTTESSGDPGAATRVVLRGAHSFINDNQPLIVVDGVPILTTAWSPNAGIANSVTNVAAISRIDDINPEDVQSVEIYSGPSASSLWGSKAANGVISISTRNGTTSGLMASRKLSVSIHSTMYSEELLRSYPLQRSFGQGLEGDWDGSPYSTYNGAYRSFSWGDKIEFRSGAADVLHYSGYPYAGIEQKNSTQTYDHATDIFRNPISWDNGVTLQGGDEWGDYYLDIANLNQQGIIKANSDLNRTSLRGNASRRFSEDVTMRFSANYVKTQTDRVQQGSNISGLLLGDLRTPPDFNSEPYLVNYVSPTGVITQNVQRTYRNMQGDPARAPGYDNPFYTIYKDPTVWNTDRFLGNAELSYDPSKWLNITYRVGADYYDERRSSLYAAGDATFPTGELVRENIAEYQINSDLMARVKQKLTDDLEGNALLGFHIDHADLYETNVVSSNFVLPTAPANLGNGQDYIPTEYDQIVRTAALYGELNLSYYQQLFLRLSGRDESASTYGSAVDKTYFYPSASLAWQFTQLSPLKDNASINSILSFGKARVAYGEAANQPPVYATVTYFGDATTANGWQNGNYYLDGVKYGGAALSSTTMGNPNLKPEMTSELEFGLDLRFLSDRVGLSVTRYSQKTTDAILQANIAPSAGYTSMWVNGAAMKNIGTEVQLMGDWLHLGAFSWSTTFNWAQNKNTVTEMYPGVQSFFLTGFEDPSSRAILNQPVGILWGTRWLRNADKSRSLALDANGFPQMDADVGIIGNPNPIYRAGITNTFKYDRLTLNVVIDIKRGGDVWNGTKGALTYFGTDASTAQWSTITAQQAATLKNFDGMTPKEFIDASDHLFRKNSDGTVSFRGYVKNFGGGDVIVDQEYYLNGPGSGFTGPAEQFVENGGYVRLREVTLSYTFPLDFIGMKSATVSATGRNLKLWTDYTGIDPETNLTGPTTGQGIDYFNNPSTRSYVFSIRLDY
jgi:TonB-linked SusC/RagA family outer membrane protein